MKKSIMFAVLAFSGCGHNAAVSLKTNALYCTTKQVTGGLQVSCPDGSSNFLANGSDGATGQNGAQGSQGVAGANGVDGQNGTNGTNGSNGINGTNGTNGVDATPVYMVKLCPNVGGSFPEYGFCAGNELYATFWSSNMAWTAKINPGSYSSTSATSACNFVVKPNCVVE